MKCHWNKVVFLYGTLEIASPDETCHFVSTELPSGSNIQPSVMEKKRRWTDQYDKNDIVSVAFMYIHVFIVHLHEVSCCEIGRAIV